jgi:hypothetical protein
MANVKNSRYIVCSEIGEICIVLHLTGACVTNNKTVIKKNL